MNGLLFTDGKVGAVSNIEWREITSYPKSIGNDIRDAVQRYETNRVLVHAVNTVTGIHAAVGAFNYQPDPDDKAPKEIHSVAALVVQTFPQLENVILAWKFSQKAAVVVIQSGMPVMDTVFQSDDLAKKSISSVQKGEFGFSGHKVLTNDRTFIPSGELVTAEQLLAHKSKATKLGGVPVNKKMLMLSVLGLIVLAASVYGGLQYKENLAKKKRQAELAKLNPIPAYTALLQENINKMGFSRESFLATLAQIRNHPIWLNGWLLTQIDCMDKFCVSHWDRKGGVTSDLVSARPDDEVLPDSTAERTILRWKNKFEFAGIPSQTMGVPHAEAVKINQDTFQVWRNAKLDLAESQKGYAIWPMPTQGDISRLPPEITLRAQPMEVNMVPDLLVDEIIAHAPKAIFWNGLSLKVAIDDKAKLLTYTFKGTTYVR
jgi:hypothetical protein